MFSSSLLSCFFSLPYILWSIIFNFYVQLHHFCHHSVSAIFLLHRLLFLILSCNHTEVSVSACLPVANKASPLFVGASRWRGRLASKFIVHSLAFACHNLTTQLPKLAYVCMWVCEKNKCGSERDGDSLKTATYRKCSFIIIRSAEALAPTSQKSKNFHIFQKFPISEVYLFEFKIFLK